MFLTNPFPGAFGLDIGDSSIKLVQLKKRRPLNRPGYFFPETLRSVSLPPGVIINGEIQQPEIVRKKILHLVGKDGAYPRIDAPWVVASLPEPQTFLKLIDISTAPKDLMAEEVSFQASKHLPFELSDTYLDWQTLNQNAEDTVSHVLLAAVPKTIADSYTYLLEASELTPLALEAEALSIARSLITSTKDYTGMARALVDIGGARACIIIYDHECIQFSKNLNFTGDMFTTAIAQGLKVEREEAERIKLSHGVRFSKDHPNYITVVDSMIGKLVEEIRATLRFYDEHFNEANPVTHITMCGGSSNLTDLDVVLSQKIKISARAGNVWKNLAPKEVTDEITDEEKRRGLSYAVSIGLALRAAVNPLTK